MLLKIASTPKQFVAESCVWTSVCLLTTHTTHYCVDPPRPCAAPRRGVVGTFFCELPCRAARFGPIRAPGKPPDTELSPPGLRIVTRPEPGRVVTDSTLCDLDPPPWPCQAPPPLPPWNVRLTPALWAKLVRLPCCKFFARCARLPPRAMLLAFLLGIQCVYALADTHT